MAPYSLLLGLPQADQALFHFHERQFGSLCFDLLSLFEESRLFDLKIQFAGLVSNSFKLRLSLDVGGFGSCLARHHRLFILAQRQLEHVSDYWVLRCAVSLKVYWERVKDNLVSIGVKCLIMLVWTLLVALDCHLSM